MSVHDLATDFSRFFWQMSFGDASLICRITQDCLNKLTNAGLSNDPCDLVQWSLAICDTSERRVSGLQSYFSEMWGTIHIDTEEALTYQWTPRSWPVLKYNIIMWQFIHLMVQDGNEHAMAYFPLPWSL